MNLSVIIECVFFIIRDYTLSVFDSTAFGFIFDYIFIKLLVVGINELF